MSKWTDFVSQIFNEGKKKNPNYVLGDAMKEASKRKQSQKLTFTSNIPVQSNTKSNTKSKLKKRRTVRSTKKQGNKSRRRR